ncbi:hypothetical protein [Flavobacterium caeni]|uniref:Uncharacterized protein n=1 Tax=Flavobacterium caeni TaxID=490189 RepID=A0A1G5HUR3_9FLAO|nr:hypothetical protein [Flavobacterium caeni]SCY67503.1 hypothetical protein SAMN02927903_02018 [Flavobacterium caeni]
MKNKRLIGIISAVGILLLVPFVAMQCSDEVQWSAFDFIIAGALLLTTGFACEWILRTVKTTQNRILLCGFALLLLALIWIELAVGIFGTRWAGS